MLRRVLTFAFLIVGLGLLMTVLCRIGAANVWEMVRRVRFFLIPILLFPITWNLLQTWAWRGVLRQLGAVLDFGTLFQARLAGATVTALFPMSHAMGEPFRAYLIEGRVPRSIGVASVLFDFWMQTLAIGLLVSVSAVLAVHEGLFFTHRDVGVLSLAVVILLLVLGLATVLKKRFTKVECASFVPVTLHFLGRLAGVIEIYGIAACLGVPLSLEQAFFLATLEVVVNVVFVFVPANIGVMEGGFAATAAFLHLDPASGIAIQMLRRVRQFFWSGLGLWAASRRLADRGVP